MIQTPLPLGVLATMVILGETYIYYSIPDAIELNTFLCGNYYRDGQLLVHMERRCTIKYSAVISSIPVYLHQWCFICALFLVKVKGSHACQF